MFNYKTLKKSRPNGWFLELGVYDEDDMAAYVVKEDDDEDGVEFDGNRQAAENYFNERESELSKTQNWKMQEAYDDEWR